MKLDWREDEINENEEAIRLAKKRLKKKREKEAEDALEKERENRIDQIGTNIAIIGFLTIVIYKIMTGTF